MDCIGFPSPVFVGHHGSTVDIAYGFLDGLKCQCHNPGTFYVAPIELLLDNIQNTGYGSLVDQICQCRNPYIVSSVARLCSSADTEYDSLDGQRCRYGSLDTFSSFVYFCSTAGIGYDSLGGQRCRYGSLDTVSPLFHFCSIASTVYGSLVGHKCRYHSHCIVSLVVVVAVPCSIHNRVCGFLDGLKCQCHNIGTLKWRLFEPLLPCRLYIHLVQPASRLVKMSYLPAYAVHSRSNCTNCI